MPRLFYVESLMHDGEDVLVNYRVAQGPGKGIGGRVEIAEFIVRVKP